MIAMATGEVIPSVIVLDGVLLPGTSTTTLLETRRLATYKLPE